MTKEQPKVHLIADEKLGGVRREYIEVERKAEVGDYVYYPADYRLAKVIPNEVADEGGLKRGETYLDTSRTCECSPLAPTNIVHIGGTRYKIAERNAEVGEKVLDISGGNDVTKGGVYEIISKTDYKLDGEIGLKFIDNAGDTRAYWLRNQYRVLTTVKPTLDELVTQITPENKHDEVFAEPTPDIHGLLANLAQRVTSLERITGELVRAKSSLESQLRDTQNNVQTFAELAETTKELTESNTKDIAFLDERTETKPTPLTEVMKLSVTRFGDGETHVEVSYGGNPTPEEVASAVSKALGGGGQ